MKMKRRNVKRGGRSLERVVRCVTIPACQDHAGILAIKVRLVWACPVCWHTMTEEQSKGYRGCPTGMHIAQHIMVEEAPCPNCYGGHFRPCQWCGDSGRVVNVPNRSGSETRPTRRMI